MRDLVVILLSIALAGCSTGRQPPNVVIILADDMGYSDIGAYGGEVDTPNLDGLAKNGLQFRHFYNAGRCCPTRAALLTGRYPHRVGMGAMVSSLGSDPTEGPYQGFLNEESATVAEELRMANYRTYMSGKWHVGEKPEHWPRQRGFDRYFGLISGASSYYEIIKNQERTRQMVLDDTRWEPPPEGFYMTDIFTEHAVSYLEDHEANHGDRPFFLYLAYTAPHWPLHALPEDIARYRDRYAIGWDSLRAERYARMQELGVIDEHFGLSPRPESVPAWEDATDKDGWALRMAVYAAMIDRMDQGIGAVLDRIESMGARDNTLVLFLSDNGGCAESVEGRRLHDPEASIGARGSYVAYQEPWANASNTPFRLYKQWVHEGGITTPLIAYWPEGIVQPGRIVPRVGHVIDLMATIRDVTGNPASEEMDGESLLPVFADAKPTLSDRTLYWEHIGNRAIRRSNWKLVWDRRRGVWELYDLHTDPAELHDLAGQESARVTELESLWEAWANDVGVRERP